LRAGCGRNRLAVDVVVVVVAACTTEKSFVGSGDGESACVTSRFHGRRAPHRSHRRRTCVYPTLFVFRAPKWITLDVSYMNIIRVAAETDIIGLFFLYIYLSRLTLPSPNPTQPPIPGKPTSRRREMDPFRLCVRRAHRQ